MSNISAAVFMKDEKLSEILGQELMLSIPGLKIEILKESPVSTENAEDIERHMIVTDRDDISAPVLIKVDEKDIDVFKITSALAEDMAKLKGKDTDVSAGCDEKIKVIAFRSDGGGSGVTAVSLTAARLLNSLAGKRALYVNMTENDGFRLYGGPELKEDIDRKRRQLAFCLEKGHPASIRGYVQVDEEGLHCLDCGGRGDWKDIFSEKISDFLSENGLREGYDFVVADMGDKGDINSDWCDSCVNVIREDDCRMKAWGEKEGQFISTWDRESFTYEEGMIKISMCGAFADNVRGLVRTLLESEIK